MKILSIAIILACALILSGCFKELPLEQVQKCEFSSDCIKVYTPGCCKCPATINKDYEEYWAQLNKKKSVNCEAAECTDCGIKSLGTDCINQTCTMMFSPVGITFP